MATQTVLSCDDSPLAIAGSVVTFATLVYAFAAGAVFYYTRIKNAPEQMRHYASEFARMSMDRERCRSSFQILTDSDEERRTNVLMRQYDMMMYEFEGYFKDIEHLFPIGGSHMTQRTGSHLMYRELSFRRLLLYGNFAISTDKLFELLPKARSFLDGCIDAVRELEARKQDDRRLEQNMMLIRIYERLDGLASVPRLQNNEEDQLINAMMTPRRQGTGISFRRPSEIMQATQENAGV